MKTNEYNWYLGEKVTLPRQEKPLKTRVEKAYAHYICSDYICIREATESQRGILMKVLGKVNSSKIEVVKGEPFCMDSYEEFFDGIRYFSYNFPTSTRIMEALDIIRENPYLVQRFEKASMHINPDSTFWVSDTTRNMLLQKKLQYLDGRDGQLYPAKDDGLHYRVTFVYFYKSNLII